MVFVLAGNVGALCFYIMQCGVLRHSFMDKAAVWLYQIGTLILKYGAIQALWFMHFIL
jgi:hypothetical protein